MSLVARLVERIGQKYSDVAEPQPVGRGARLAIVVTDQSPDLIGDDFRFSMDARAAQNGQAFVRLKRSVIFRRNLQYFTSKAIKHPVSRIFYEIDVKLNRTNLREQLDVFQPAAPNSRSRATLPGCERSMGGQATMRSWPVAPRTARKGRRCRC